MGGTEMPRTGQDKSAFGIGVINLDCFAVHRVYAIFLPHFRMALCDVQWETHMSPGFVAAGPGMFSQRGVTVMRLMLPVSY